MIKCVYVAGPYSADNPIGVFDNMRRGMRAAARVFARGLAPFTPWHDFHHQLMLREGETLTIDDYYRYSLTWLERSDAVLVIGRWQESKGTVNEVARAEELGLPVFFGEESLFSAAFGDAGECDG